MHLSGVFACLAQDVHNLPDWVFGFFRPFYYFYDSFIAIFPSFQFIFGNENVICQRTVFGNKESIEFVDFQCSDECIVCPFDDFNYFSFGVAVLAFCKQGNFDFVVVHGVCRVSFGYKDGLSSVLRDERVLTIAFTLKNTRHNQSVVVQLILPFFNFL